MALISWVFRFLGCLVLAAGTVLAVGDLARSLASSRVRMMTIMEATDVAGVGRSVFSANAGEPRTTGILAADGRGADLIAVLARQPASVVLGLAGVGLLALGRRRRGSRRNGFARPGSI